MLWKVILLTAAAGMGGTGLGGVVACCFRRDSERMVSLLLSFAAGVMTAVVCFDLLGDAMDQEGMGLLPVCGGVLAGYLAVALLNGCIQRQQRGQRSGLFLAGVVMGAAIALHNMPEGMVIGASCAKGAGVDTLGRSGLVMAAVIGMHNVPEGMAVAVPLIAGGMGRGRAVLTTAVTGAPTVLGAVLGYFLGTLGPATLSLCLSFASGAMLYVVFGELLPESALLWRSRLPALAAVAGILVGMGIVYG